MALSGDQVSGFAWDGKAAWFEERWRQMLQPTLAAGVPHASILGNHDGELAGVGWVYGCRCGCGVWGWGWGQQGRASHAAPSTWVHELLDWRLQGCWQQHPQPAHASPAAAHLLPAGEGNLSRREIIELDQQLGGNLTLTLPGPRCGRGVAWAGHCQQGPAGQ